MNAPATMGVEEEFLLVDGDGRLVQEAPETLTDTEDDGADLKGELLRCQVESATAVHTRLDHLWADIGQLRERLAAGSGGRGLRLIASGTVVHGQLGDARIGLDPRYEQMVRHFGRLVFGGITCGCHVHVGVNDREQAVRAINELRPWLPTLLALSANSPFHEGRDTGYASSRYLLWTRWSTAGPPPHLDSAEEYETIVRGLLDSEAAMDRKMVYWDVRPSEHQDTLEFRVQDVLGTVDEAAFAGILGRALAVEAMERVDRGLTTTDPIPQEVLRGYLWRAARDGFEGASLDPRTRELRPVAEIVEELVERLPDRDETAFAKDVLGMLRADGGGAQRQRAAYRRREDHGDVVDMLARQTRAGSADLGRKL